MSRATAAVVTAEPGTAGKRQRPARHHAADLDCHARLPRVGARKMASISTLATADTELCADAVAFCPSSSTLLACGCYELLPGEPSRRVGRLTLLSTLGDRLSTLQQVGDDGVLDCAWAPPRAGRPQLLATASSTGHARLLRLQSTADSAADACADPTRPRLEPHSACECVDAGVCMALDWGEGAAGASARLALSSTAGRLYVLDGSPAGLVPMLAWQALSPPRTPLECRGAAPLANAVAMYRGRLTTSRDGRSLSIARKARTRSIPARMMVCSSGGTCAVTLLPRRPPPPRTAARTALACVASARALPTRRSWQAAHTMR